MKSYLIAAGALLLGTSALAVAAEAGTNAKTVAAWEKALTGVDKSAWSKGDAKLAETKGWEADSSKIQLASFDPAAGKPEFVKPNVAPDAFAEAKMTAGETAPVELASFDDTKPVPAFETTAYEDSAAKLDPSTEPGMGGPIEEMAGMPTISTVNYPPCDPGPGDDRCIQLYEPGVREQLASWTHPTGGLAGADQSAMGGPYEPVDETVDATTDKLVSGLPASPVVPESQEEMAFASADGVGGPVEAQSGYPPCSPGPGDDRCIQLYEPGVTGLGN